MSLSDVIALLGGVALFLFGMGLMGDGLKKVAGSKLELILYRLSSTPLKGILLGTGVTAIIQSSSATSVMVVGFVNSEMMKLTQAIAVIMGSLIGTSVTGWLIALSSIEGASGALALLNTETLSAVIAIIGILMRMTSKKRAVKQTGDIFLGFSVLMFGMKAMSGAVSGLKSEPAFISVMTGFENPVLGIIAGVAITAILQSASASVGVLQALTSTGAITFAAAFPMLLGIAFGASFPVLMSGLNAGVDGKRTSLTYPIITGLGAVIIGVIFYAVNGILQFSFMGDVQNAFSIALANTEIRIIMVILMAPFMKLVERMVIRAVKDDEFQKAQNRDFERLEERFLNYPSLAVEQSRLVINNMAQKAKANFYDAVKLLPDFNEKGYEKVVRLENQVDKYEDRIGKYLMKITERELSEEQNDAVGEYLHCITDFERISDHALNIAERAREKREKGIHFTDNAWNELHVLSDAVGEIIATAAKAFTDNSLELAVRVEPLEEVIDNLCDEMKIHHIERLQNGECDVQRGYVFNDLLTDFERVSDHCSNVAVAIIELRGEKLLSHEYTDNIKNLHKNNFDEFYEEYREKYHI
ncbi:MAG: Na/Pi cotransporter family protein [Lachnospiraceae bacterium]|nr:Na/Pi cotransporter family protein [Lachnospiraceae bacterium]